MPLLTEHLWLAWPESMKSRERRREIMGVEGFLIEPGGSLALPIAKHVVAAGAKHTTRPMAMVITRKTGFAP
ncbi:hypothetical protein BHE74_00057552 [Ensete ventricosum]|nr:hypothetical protein GW17_00038119 [Ensete ventricosum]RWW37352.1 hypothetical protein BHE74_00057552 [Ensete ventricosum]